MNKKSYISLLFLLAFSVLFMHSAIPHHHDDDYLTQQAGDHHGDDHDMDHNPLSKAFASFHHEQGGQVINEAFSPAPQYCKIGVDKETARQIQYFISSIEKPPLLHNGQYLVSPPPSPHLDNKYFRGPPSVQA